MRLPKSETEDLRHALRLVVSGVRVGALLPRFDAHAHLPALAASPTPCILATVQGSTFLLHRGLLCDKVRAFESALADGGGAAAAALAAACGSARAVAPFPVSISLAERTPRALEDGTELRPWLQRHTLLLSQLLLPPTGGSPYWRHAASGSAHGAAVMEAEGVAAAGVCPVALAGLFLDYPIVYTLSGSTENCLGGLDLELWRGGQHVSFSLPVTAACARAREAVALWRELLAERCARAGTPPLAVSWELVNKPQLAV